MNSKHSLVDIAVFLIVLMGLTIPLQYLLIGLGASPGLVYGLIMWSVGIAAIVTLSVRGLSVGTLGWKWGAWKYHLIAVAIPAGYGLFAYISANALGLTDFPNAVKLTDLRSRTGLEEVSGSLGVTLALIIVVLGGGITGYARALGEEIGWRGFLTPRITSSIGFLFGTLVTGLIWAVWHWPALILLGYNAGGPLYWELGAFSIMVIAISGPFAWLRLKSGSLWPAATYHAAHNIFIQSVFDPLTVRGQSAVTIVSEFGVLLALTTAIFSLPFWYLGVKGYRENLRFESAET